MRSGYLMVNQLKVAIPNECMIVDENLKSMTCIKDNDVKFLGIKMSSEFEKNILSSEYKKRIDYLYYGTFVELSLGKNRINFLKIKDSNILVIGNDENLMLDFSLDIYNQIHKAARLGEVE